MISIDIASKSLGQMLYDSAYPKTDYESGEQKMSADGQPLWQIGVLLRQPGSRRTEAVTVTVPLPQDPATVLEPFTPVMFGGLRVMTGENNGRRWVSFSADSVGTPKAGGDRERG